MSYELVDFTVSVLWVTLQEIEQASSCPQQAQHQLVNGNAEREPLIGHLAAVARWVTFPE